MLDNVDQPDGNYYHPHFTCEETGTQRAEATCLESHKIPRREAASFLTVLRMIILLKCSGELTSAMVRQLFILKSCFGE